jgi:hypothetical protein
VLPRLSQKARIHFKNELDLLSNTLGQVYKFEGPDGVIAYSLCKRTLKKMEMALMCLQEVYNYYPELKPDGSDSFPTWGLKGSPAGYWLEFDFEIRCTCYRWDTEKFLEGLYEFLNPIGNSSATGQTKFAKSTYS